MLNVENRVKIFYFFQEKSNSSENSQNFTLLSVQVVAQARKPL